jgi:hypothetical protein
MSGSNFSSKSGGDIRVWNALCQQHNNKINQFRKYLSSDLYEDCLDQNKLNNNLCDIIRDPIRNELNEQYER